MSTTPPSLPRLPVVLVHGIWNTAGIFTPLKDYLETQGHRVYALSMQPNNGDAPLEVLAQQVAQFIARYLGKQQPFNLLGFSMGGLISRYYIQRLGGLSRVRCFVTVAAPHQGTLLSFFSHRPGVRQMRPGSPFLRALNADTVMLQRTCVFALWTPFDLLIVPSWHSCFSAGQTQLLWVPTHNAMIRHPRGLSAIATLFQH